MKLKNPIMPISEHVPDTEAHVMPDGRVYFYGSYDGDKGGWCSDIYKVFSSNKMNDIVDHGQSFSVSQLNSNTAGLLYAPDCIYNNGKYYLYICCRDSTEWVAESDKPYGPFVKPTKIEGISGIDPAIFLDDDGQAYYYWGQFSLNGCKLKKDMRSIEEGSIVNNLITQEKHFFHEGSSVRKRNGIYYERWGNVNLPQMSRESLRQILYLPEAICLFLIWASQMKASMKLFRMMKVERYVLFSLCAATIIGNPLALYMCRKNEIDYSISY